MPLSPHVTWLRFQITPTHFQVAPYPPQSVHEPVDFFYQTDKEINKKENIFKQRSVSENLEQNFFGGQNQCLQKGPYFKDMVL